jgi:tRNA(fMet)-specific endonuclease VapC
MDSVGEQPEEVYTGLHEERTTTAFRAETEASFLMKLMLDTNICIYVIKKQPPAVLERFTKYSVGDIGISIITWAELIYGASKSLHPARNRTALEEFIAPLEVAEFDRAAAEVYGSLRAGLEEKGMVVGAMDLLIAAHAISIDARIVTNNLREFQRIPGLRVENWVSSRDAIQ